MTEEGYVNTALTAWETDSIPRRAGVSSFGMGGTNAHVILEEAPVIEKVSAKTRPWQLLPISTKTKFALETATTNLAVYLKQRPQLNLADVAYTLAQGRKAFEHRRMLVCQTAEAAAMALTEPDSHQVFTTSQEPSPRPVVFMFSGQGTQYINMGEELYQFEPTFRKQVDLCSKILIPHLGIDLRDLLYPQPSAAEKSQQQLNQTAIAQPAVFVIEYALAQLWISWGVIPQAMIGHSIGEYVAACLAGVFSLSDALALVAARGRMMQQLPPGAMLSISLSPEEVQPFLSQEVCLAAMNGPSQCVVSGSIESIEATENLLTHKGVECRRLHTSHAFHSAMMEPILTPFADLVKSIEIKRPKIPYISNVTGTWITAAEYTNPSYWAKHIRSTVRFAEGLQ